METHNEKSSEICFLVLQHVQLHFGSGRVSEVNILNNICLMHPYVLTHVCFLETHQEKSSEVIIPVLEHGKLHVGSGRVSVLKIAIKIEIGPSGPHEGSNPRLKWKRTNKSRLK